MLQGLIEAGPFYRGLMREPSILPLGVAAGRLLACRYRFFLLKGPRKICFDLAHADRSHDRHVGIKVAGKKRLDFFNCTIVEHGFEALVATLIEPFARRQQDERTQVDVVANAARSLLLPIGQAPAGRQDDFERTRDACGVAWVKPLGRPRIEFSQLIVIFGHASLANRGSCIGVYWGDRRDTFEQCP